MSNLITSPAPPVMQRWLPLLIIAIGGGLTGFSGVLMRFSEIGPVATGGWRLLIAAGLLMPLVRLTEAEGKAGPRSLALLWLAGLFFALDIGFYHVSLGLTSIAHATLIVNLAPVVALAAGAWLFSERLGAAKLAGLVIALCGAMLITVMRGESAGTLSGNSLAVIALLGYALYLVTVKKACRYHTTLTIMVWSSLSASIALFIAAAATGEQLVPSTMVGWAVVIAMGLVTHVLGQGLIAFGMREAPVGLGSILLLTQPLVAAIGAWIVFAERLSPPEIAGALLVLSGLAVASQAKG